MLTLALSSWSLSRHLHYFGTGSWVPSREGEPLEITAFPLLARSYGIAHLEICQSHLATSEPNYIERVAAAVRDAGTHVVNVPIDAGDLAQPDPHARAADMRTIERWIDAASRLGASFVRVNTGHVGDQALDDVFARVASAYRDLAAYCRDRGLTLLIENHWGLSADPATILRLLAAVDAGNLRLCPDFGNFAPATRMAGLAAMLPHAAVVHAKVLDVDEVGVHTAFDLQACLDLVRKSGFAGVLSIEFEGEGDQRAGIATAKSLIERAVGDLLIAHL